MFESKPHVESTTTKKVLIKTIETRDGQVWSTLSDFQSIKWFSDDLLTAYAELISLFVLLVQVINESTQNHDDFEWSFVSMPSSKPQQ